MGIIAVFGGTFNPIHIGHSEIISCLSKQSDIEKIIIIPTKIPPHKEANLLADSIHRYNMCAIIASDYDNVEVSNIELNREGKSYTIDTISSLKSEYKNNKIALTIGGDMLVSFKKWKNYKEILSNCILFTFNRAGISCEEYQNAINSLKTEGAEIHSLDVQITDISSTKIRNDLTSEGECEFLDKRIRDYILKNMLYGV